MADKKGIFSLFRKRKIKGTATDTAKPTIETPSNQETTEYVTKDFAEKLIREKVEGSINVSRADIEGKLEERTIKLFSEFDEKVKDAINVSRADVEGKLEERTIKLFSEFDEKVKDVINVSRADVEGKIEESANKLFKEFDEKIKLNSDDMLSRLRTEYRKQTEDLVQTISSASLVKRLNIYVIGIGSAFVIILILLSLYSYGRIKSTAMDTAQLTITRQAALETRKYVTKDTTEKLIRKNVDDAMNVSLSDIAGKLEESTNKLFKEMDKRITFKSDGILSDIRAEYKKLTEDLLNTIKNNESSKGVGTSKPVIAVSGKTGNNLAEDDGPITRTEIEKQQGFEDWYKKGSSELLRSNYSGAIVFFSNAIKLDPENHNVYHKRGDAYFSLRNYKKAIDDFNKTIELDPENFAAYGRRGDAYDKLKQYEKAIENYEKAINRNPSYAPAYNNRGNTYYFIGQYEKAIEDYKKTIELDPENVVAYSNIGIAYTGLEQYEKAIENFTNVIRLVPEDGNAYVQLSRIKVITGNYEGALDIVTKALSLPLAKEIKALALYIECITKRILNIDTSKSEAEFNKILQEDFITKWNLNKIESRLKNAEIDDETKIFISEKTALLKKHLKE